MKEFYLVPVQVYENLIIKQNASTESAKQNIIRGGNEKKDHSKAINENKETIANNKVANMQIVTAIPPPAKIPLKSINNQKKRKETPRIKKKKIMSKTLTLKTVNTNGNK